MSKNKIVIGIILVGALIAIVFGYLAVNEHARQTAAASATVVAAKPERSGRSRSTLVTLSYQAGAVAAQGKARVRGNHVDDFPAGATVPVCYDPAEVASVRIAKGTCG